MSFVNIEKRTTDDLNSASDINQLMENTRILKGGDAGETPVNNIKGLNDIVNNLKGLYLRKCVTLVDSTSYTVTTAWSLTCQFSEILDFKAGSKIKISYHMPCRNDSTSWGGAYIEPQVSFNSGSTWFSLGSSGYDANIMNSGSPSIGSYFNSILIDPQISTNFSLKVRFYCASYDGTAWINLNHNINAISGNAPLISGNNGLQHYAHIIVEELATIV